MRLSTSHLLVSHIIENKKKICGKLIRLKEMIYITTAQLNTERIDDTVWVDYHKDQTKFSNELRKIFSFYVNHAKEKQHLTLISTVINFWFSSRNGSSVFVSVQRLYRDILMLSNDFVCILLYTLVRNLWSSSFLQYGFHNIFSHLILST